MLLNTTIIFKLKLINNSMAIPSIPLFFDVDMTITEEYQQEPLFRKYADKIQNYCTKNQISHFWDMCAKKREQGSQYGVDYLNLMIEQARSGGCFEGLSNRELLELGTLVKPAQGLSQGLKALKNEFKDRAKLDIYLVSVGILPLIQGFIHAQGLEDVITGIAASEFGETTGVISEPKRIVFPFGKNEPIIQFMKGKPELLNTPMYKEEYKYDYRNMIVIGDGITDSSMMAYAKKKGGSSIVLYTENDTNGFKKALEIGNIWVDYVLPRNYTPNETTYNLFKEAIERKLTETCSFRPSTLHDLRKGNLKHPDEKIPAINHIKSCPDCQNYFIQKRVMPNKNIEKINDLRMII